VVVSAKLQGSHISPNEPELVAALADVLDARPPYQVIALDAPVGLLSEAQEGGRRCDRDARALLGPVNTDVLALPPTRAALDAPTWEEAAALSGGLDAVTWCRMDRIREIQREMEPYRQRVVYEVRAELTYFHLNDERPLKFPKRTNRGRDERRALLEARIPDVERVLDARLAGVRPWHLLDGCAALWTSRRIMARAAARLPLDPEWDDRGLRMEIVR
jgi:predicted RNase H-like nuclease